MPEPRTTRRAPLKKPGKKKTTKTTSKRPAELSRQPSPVFLQKLQPSPAFARVIGKRPVARTGAIKKLWTYIKRNKLQNRANPRMIDLDDKLRGVFGDREQISMFELSSVLVRHLVPLP